MQQHVLAAGLTWPDGAQADTAFGRLGPAEFYGIGGLELLADQLVVKHLESIRSGLGLVQQVIGGFG